MEALREELEYYRGQQPELLQRHSGLFALIKGRQLVGVYPTREEAYTEGVHRFGREPFLIQRITESEQPEKAPLLAFTIARAGLQPLLAQRANRSHRS